jgi:hypothetical protein
MPESQATGGHGDAHDQAARPWNGMDRLGRCHLTTEATLVTVTGGFPERSVSGDGQSDHLPVLPSHLASATSSQ